MCIRVIKKTIERIIVIGDGNGSEFERDTKSKFKELKNVTFLGKMMNPFPYIKKASYLLQFSNMESWGLAVNEALVLGVPCVVTNYDSAKEQITDGVNGYILKKDLSNLDEIIQKMSKIPDFQYEPKENYKKWIELL